MKGAQKWIGEKLNWNINKMRTIFHLPFTLHNFPLPPLTRSAFFPPFARKALNFGSACQSLTQPS